MFWGSKTAAHGHLKDGSSQPCLALAFLLLGSITIHPGFTICLLLFQLFNDLSSSKNTPSPDLLGHLAGRESCSTNEFGFISPLLQHPQTPGLQAPCKLRPSIRHYSDDGGERGIGSLWQMEQMIRFFIDRGVRFYLHGCHGPVLDQPSVSGLY